MVPSKPSIAIVGGGPSGLCLGVLLHKRGIPFTIYDLRNEPSESALLTPSGPLDLHEETGLSAIRACGLWDQFIPLTTDCSQTLLVIDKDGNATYTNDGELEYRPEISRNALTRLLLSAVPAESIKWEHKLLSAVRKPDGKVSLDFGPNGIMEHDFVVGADGAWSKVRPLLTDVKPHYGGIQYTTLHIVNAASRYPALAKLVGPGTCWALGDSNGVFSQRGVRETIRLYVAISTEQEGFLQETTSELEPEAFKKVLVEEPAFFGTWGDKTKDLISTACDEEAAFTGVTQLPAFKPMYMLPIGHRWAAKPAAALIGDAAHLMMPWAGEGVNQAMRDALDLADVITKGYQTSSTPLVFQETLVPLVAEFDESMFERTKEAAETTWANSKKIFAPGAAGMMASLTLPPGHTKEFPASAGYAMLSVGAARNVVE